MGVGLVVEKAKQRSRMTQMLEFRVAVMSTCTHKGHYSTTKPRQTYIVTVGAVSGPHCQIGALHWHHFTSCELTWLVKARWKSRLYSRH